jgi:hypothetical protein
VVKLTYLLLSTHCIKAAYSFEFVGYQVQFGTYSVPFGILSRSVFENSKFSLIH